MYTVPVPLTEIVVQQDACYGSDCYYNYENDASDYLVSNRLSFTHSFSLLSV